MFALKGLRQQGPGIKNEIDSVIRQLYNMGIIHALMEVMIERDQALPTSQLLETNAMRAAWGDGYSTCLKDLTEFTERFLNKEQGDTAAPDFGAGIRLLKSGDLTEKEYVELYGTKPPAGYYPVPKPWNPINRAKPN